MAPSAIPIFDTNDAADTVQQEKDNLGSPRLNIQPSQLLFKQDVEVIGNEPRPYTDRGAAAVDKKKTSLICAASSVTDLTTHIRTEISGVQLADLNNDQRDELALLIAERRVVFFRDQHYLTPQVQRSLGEYYFEV